MAAVPRIFEKVYNKILEGAKQGGLKQKIFEWAVAVGKQGSKLRQAGQGAGRPARAQAQDRRQARVLEGQGSGSAAACSYFISGSAPLSREIAEFFHACGILILEGYGLTESSAASFVNRPTKYAFGSRRHADAGHRAQARARGRRDPDEVARDHAGLSQPAGADRRGADRRTAGCAPATSARSTRSGFLRITDRKKDLIKTSGGKYIAPQAIEGKLKATCPYISQVIVHGDKRNFVTALVTLDEEATMKWAKEQGLNGKSYAEVVQSPEVKALLSPYFDEVNKTLAKYETVKQFAILPKDLSIDEGELTPSLKVKRKVVEKKYATLLDKMYEGAVAAE